MKILTHLFTQKFHRQTGIEFLDGCKFYQVKSERVKFANTYSSFCSERIRKKGGSYDTLRILHQLQSYYVIENKNKAKLLQEVKGFVRKKKEIQPQTDCCLTRKASIDWFHQPLAHFRTFELFLETSEVRRHLKVRNCWG